MHLREDDSYFYVFYLIAATGCGMKYKGHFKTVKGIKHFDEFIMSELKTLAEKNQTLNACSKSAI